MNERIQKLALQAGIKRVDLHYTEEQPPYTIVSYRGSPDNSDPLAKFAELIVRECATAFEAEVDSWKEMDPYQGSIKRQGTKAIKQHFGVEE